MTKHDYKCEEKTDEELLAFYKEIRGTPSFDLAYWTFDSFEQVVIEMYKRGLIKRLM